MAVATPEDICNLALDHLGKPSILSLSETSVEALRCRRQYDVSRRLVLVRSPWTFARKTVALAGTTNEKIDAWSFAYDLPNDMQKLHRLVTSYDMLGINGERVPKYIEGGKLYTNIEKPHLQYIFDNEDTTSWSAMFDDAVALMLAARMAPNTTRRKSDVQELRTAYEDAWRLAAEVDATQDDGSWRFGDGYADEHVNATGGRAQVDGSTIWGN